MGQSETDVLPPTAVATAKDDGSEAVKEVVEKVEQSAEVASVEPAAAAAAAAAGSSSPAEATAAAAAAVEEKKDEAVAEGEAKAEGEAEEKKKELEEVFTEENKEEAVVALKKGELTPEKIAELVAKEKELVEKAGVSTESLDNATLERFLHARAFKPDRAAKQLVAHLKWLESFVPLGHIPAEEVAGTFEVEKVFLQQKEGAKPVLIFEAIGLGLKRDTNEFKKFLVHCIDKTVASLPEGETTFTTILDLKDTTHRTQDAKAIITGFEMLQAHYPERLHRLLIINVPFVFWALWKVVAPFIDRVTRQKIIFVPNKQLKEVLVKEVDADQLPEAYGGSVTELTNLKDAEVANWPPPLPPTPEPEAEAQVATEGEEAKEEAKVEESSPAAESEKVADETKAEETVPTEAAKVEEEEKKEDAPKVEAKP